MALIAENLIADALGLDERSVQLRCVDEDWPLVKRPKKGGSDRCYIDYLLPDKIRKAVVAHPSTEQTVPVPAVSSPSVEKPTTIPERAKEEGLAKYRLIKAYQKVKNDAPHGKKGDAAKDFILAYNSGILMKEVFEKTGKVSKTTLDNLEKRLREYNDDYLCLCDGRGGWKKYGTPKWKGRGLSESAKALFLKCYLNQSRPTVSMAIRGVRMALNAKGYEEPASDKTFRRWLKDYEKRNSHVICMAREGVKAYVDRFGAYANRDAGQLKVGQCLVADGKTLNFTILHPMTRKPVRMTLIVFFDWASRYPAGWQILPTEDTVGILAAFRNAVICLGKYPESAYLDNGRAFKSQFFTKEEPDFEEMAGLYARVGTAVAFAKPYNGRAKVVERFFRTVQDQLEFMMPSYCGDSIATKPAWMSRNETFHQAWHEAKTQNWVPDIREAGLILQRYFEWYANQPHADLEDTPANLFLPERGPGVDPIQLNHDFLWRKAVTPHKCRITLWNIDYEADELLGFKEGSKVIAMFDTADMRRVWCYQDGEYICEARPVAALHPLAKLFGDEVSMAQVKEHNKRLSRMKKETQQQLAAVGISKKTQETMNILPWAEKVPILMNGRADDPQAIEGARKALPEPKGKAKAEGREISDEELKRLEALLDENDGDEGVGVESPMPQEEDEIPEAEILFETTEDSVPDTDKTEEEDELSRLEMLLDSAEVDAHQERIAGNLADEEDEMRRLEALLAESEPPSTPEDASEEDELERLNRLLKDE